LNTKKLLEFRKQYYFFKRDSTPEKIWAISSIGKPFPVHTSKTFNILSDIYVEFDLLAKKYPLENWFMALEFLKDKKISAGIILLSFNLNF